MVHVLSASVLCEHINPIGLQALIPRKYIVCVPVVTQKVPSFHRVPPTLAPRDRCGGTRLKENFESRPEYNMSGYVFPGKQIVSALYEGAKRCN